MAKMVNIYVVPNSTIKTTNNRLHRRWLTVPKKKYPVFLFTCTTSGTANTHMYIYICSRHERKLETEPYAQVHSSVQQQPWLESPKPEREMVIPLDWLVSCARTRKTNGTNDTMEYWAGRSTAEK